MTYGKCLRDLLLTLTAVGICHNASAVTALRATVNIRVPFSAGSSVVPEVSAAEIKDQAACLRTIALEAVVIVAPGDASPLTDGIAEMKLAAERANALRISFLDLGVPDWRIYTQAEANVGPPYIQQQPHPARGVARIEYMGVCVGNADCQVECKDQGR